jgi:acetyltransferase
MRSQPEELECAARLRDGTVVRLRSIHPEDEPLLQDFAAHMGAEDMRHRFFVAMRGLSHQLAAQLSHIDLDRERALLALAEGAEELLGVARFSAKPGNRAAEFAIAVRSDWKGRGLGHLLMTRLIQVARQRGVDELVGKVLPENAAMLRLCRGFGFAVAIDPHDPKLLRVSRSLQGPDALTST